MRALFAYNDGSDEARRYYSVMTKVASKIFTSRPCNAFKRLIFKNKFSWPGNCKWLDTAILVVFHNLEDE